MATNAPLDVRVTKSDEQRFSEALGRADRKKFVEAERVRIAAQPRYALVAGSSAAELRDFVLYGRESTYVLRGPVELCFKGSMSKNPWRSSSDVLVTINRKAGALQIESSDNGWFVVRIVPVLRVKKSSSAEDRVRLILVPKRPASSDVPRGGTTVGHGW